MKLKKPASSNFIIIVVLMIAAAFIFVGGLTPLPKSSPPSDTTPYQLSDSAAPEAKKALQLGIPTAASPTEGPTPTPINYCDHDNGRPTTPGCVCDEFLVTCTGGVCSHVDMYQGRKYPAGNNCDIRGKNYHGGYLPSQSDFNLWCRDEIDQTKPRPDGTYCYWKPVIYLYPTEKTLVDVSVETAGDIFISDPQIEYDGLASPERSRGGWRNVTAYPSGKLIYQGKEYRELFYESENDTLRAPTRGKIVKSEAIGPEIDKLVRKLGLNDWETNELTGFWIPKLKEEFNSPYIMLSILDRDEKDRTDKVYVTPKPDTMIDFILYFKPLDKMVEIEPLELPKTPKRIGFTVVEWGGTIDNK